MIGDDLYPETVAPSRLRAVAQQASGAAILAMLGLGVALWWAQDSARRVWRAVRGPGGQRG